MRNAPPVLVPVGRFVWGGRIALMLALLTALVWLVLARMQAMSAARMALLALACLFAAGLSWLAWQREQLPSGELAWDGEDWWYRPADGKSQRVRVSLNWDAGRAMLLRVQARPRGGLAGTIPLAAGLSPALAVARAAVCRVRSRHFVTRLGGRSP